MCDTFQAVNFGRTDWDGIDLSERGETVTVLTAPEDRPTCKTALIPNDCEAKRSKDENQHIVAFDPGDNPPQDS